MDAECYEAPMPSVGEVFVRRVLNEESENVGSEHVQRAFKIYLEAGKATLAKLVLGRACRIRP